MEEGALSTTCSITRVVNAERWFKWEESISYNTLNPEQLGYYWSFVLGAKSEICRVEDSNAALLSFIGELYNKKIGEISSRWDDEVQSCAWEFRERIEFQHAQVKLGDLFDYFTTNSVLQFPEWVRFKYVVEDYLLHDPRVRYHPTRVQEFIEQRGLEQLEEMP